MPEAAFGEGKDPLSKAVKTWLKVEEMEPEVVEALEIRDPYFALLMHGPQANLKVEEAKEKINWQRGQLECKVISGQNGLQVGILNLQMTMRVFRHPDLPFGIAGLHEDLNVKFGDGENKVVIKVALKDHGKDAKAKLPELLK